MRTSRNELTLTEWIVLALAREAPTHGWAIVRALRPDGSIGEVWSCRGPLVYRAIRLLVEAGLLEPGGTAEGDGPTRTILNLTPSGIEAVDEWLHQPVRHVRDLRTELLVKLLLLDRRGLDRSLLVSRQRERLAVQVTSLVDRAEHASESERLVDAWRAATARAALAFLDEIGEGAPSGSDDQRDASQAR